MVIPCINIEGGDAYDYMDRDFHLLSGTDRVSFLDEKQVEAKEESRPDNRTAEQVTD